MENKTPVLYIWILDDEPAEDFCKDHWINSRGQGQDGFYCLFTVDTKNNTSMQTKNFHNNFPFMIHMWLLH